MAVATLIATACSGQQPGSTASEASTPAVTGPHFTNPVYPDNVPDPALLRVGSTFYLFATQGDGRNIQELTSSDLVHWTRQSDALPTLPTWAQGDTWAPEVIKAGDEYVMFFAARDQESGHECLGRAESRTPQGPYADTSGRPFVCQRDLGGSIDPNPVRDSSGKLYLYWKNDGNCCSRPVHLWGQELNSDATALIGSPAPLLTNTEAWQGNLIEAPEMVEHDTHRYLFYAANNYGTTAYAEGVAACDGPLGPCHNLSVAAPLMASAGSAAGPGHGYPFMLPSGQWWILYHAWDPSAIGSTYPGRQLWLSPLTWKDGTPQPVVPSSTVTQLPAIQP